MFVYGENANNFMVYTFIYGFFSGQLTPDIAI